IETVKTIIFFLLVAFLPSVLWIVWLVRKASDGPGFASILGMFIWGAVFAVIIAIILEALAPGFSPWKSTSSTFFMVVVLAPLAEEFAKPLGLKLSESNIIRVRDGIILGATAGLGFAATENLLYGQAALADGNWTAFWATAVLRGIAACALHASATAITGRGFAWANLNGRSVLVVIPFFLLAAFLHGLYNYLAIQGTLLALMGAVLLALTAVSHTGYSVR
ncbi:MAG: PrsW family intramembrane metalloprotease, partial [Candidatus Thermoplasmatota archaeon]|nr:PrsW family intramembrane metalloprotease [Candidatus Thermoplasmatota archaeon]